MSFQDTNHSIIIEDFNNNSVDEHLNENKKHWGNDLVKNDGVKNEVIRSNTSYPKQGQSRLQTKNRISYDDILKSMNMQMKDGKLEIIKKEVNYSPQVPYQNNPQQNSYIYNKYFSDQKYSNEPPQRPLTQNERRILFIRRQVEIENQRQRIRQIKSKKLNFSSDNINISYGRQPHNMNRLFKFVGK